MSDNPIELIERLTKLIGALTVELERKEMALEQAYQIIGDMEQTLRQMVSSHD